MQANNKLRVFSANATAGSSGTYRRLSDAELNTSTLVSNGAGYGEVAESILYNSLSLALSKPVVALVDFIALKNSGTTFGQDLSIDNWITAVSNTFVDKSSFTSLSNLVGNIELDVHKIKTGETVVPTASKLETARTITITGNGTNSSATFDGQNNITLTLLKSSNATNADLATTATKANTISFTTTEPTSSPAAGTLLIYVGSTLPSTRYDRVLYLITY